MNIPVASIGIFFFILLSIFPESVNAQQNESEGSISDILIFVQTFVIDSDKNLIAYLNSNEFTYVDTGKLNTFLDFVGSANDKKIEVNQKKFQIITREKTIFSESESVIASTLLVESIDDNPILLVRFTHDGFPIKKGDQVTSIWTFVRPIN